MGLFAKNIRPAAVSFALFSVICGIAYTVAITGIAQLAFREKANGSVISQKSKDGTTRIIGSSLLAQEFSRPGYLIGRPAGITNLSPNGTRERGLVAERVTAWRALDPEGRESIPVDLVTASASGVDPYISPEAAEFQVGRIAHARGIPEESVRAAIEKNTQGRLWALFGEPRVSVLGVNLALDGLM